MNAIPTKYAGVQFRSRLEAKWAAFFDLCGWRWNYEPVDLKGWIPDFSLTDGFSREVLVEVKPFRELWEFDGKRYANLTNYSVLLLGQDLLLGDKCEDSGGVSIGWSSAYRELDEEGDWIDWVECDFVRSCRCSRLSEPKQIGSELHWAPHHRGECSQAQIRMWNARAWIGGAHDRFEMGYYVEEHEAVALWREAGNRVQWKAPR